MAMTGASTVTLAAAVPPVTVRKVPPPASKVAEIVPVTLFLTPKAVPVTFTENEHELFAAMFNESRLTEPLPGFAAMDAPLLVTHVPAKPFGVDTTRPLGNESVNVTLISGVVAFGLFTVKVRAVFCPTAMSAGMKALARVGATTVGPGVTVKLAVLLGAPGPLSLELIGPVVLLSVPEAVGVTSTEMKQDPLAGVNSGLREAPRRPGASPVAGASVPP